MVRKVLNDPVEQFYRTSSFTIISNHFLIFTFLFVKRSARNSAAKIMVLQIRPNYFIFKERSLPFIYLLLHHFSGVLKPFCYIDSFKSSHHMLLYNRCSSKFRKIHRKTSMPESLF